MAETGFSLQTVENAHNIGRLNVLFQPNEHHKNYLRQHDGQHYRLRRNPGAVIEEAGNLPVAILNHNRATAYLVSAEAFEAMMDRLDDIELAELVRERRGGETVNVTLDEL
jgi:antitoxin StbD